MNNKKSLIPINFLVAEGSPRYPPKSVVVIFGKSKSQFFKKALRFAKNKSDFQENGDEFFATFDWKKSAKDVVGLLNIVGGWKSTRVLVDGKLENPSKFEVHSWCFNSRKFSTLPEDYCEKDNTPCRAIYFYELESQEWKNDYGYFDEHFVWHFDKEKIKRKLVLEFDKVKYCPAMDAIKIAKLQKIVEEIPDIVNPRKEADWDFIFPYGNSLSITISLDLGDEKKPKEKTEAVPMGVKKIKAGEVKDESFCLPGENDGIFNRQYGQQESQPKEFNWGCLILIIFFIFILATIF